MKICQTMINLRWQSSVDEFHVCKGKHSEVSESVTLKVFTELGLTYPTLHVTITVLPTAMLSLCMIVLEGPKAEQCFAETWEYRAVSVAEQL